MKGLKTKVMLIVFVLLALIVGLGVTTKDNWRLKRRMDKKDAKHQEQLKEFSDYRVETTEMLVKWEQVADSLKSSNLKISEGQELIILDLTEKRKRNDEQIDASSTWSDVERDAFWARESTIQDTLIAFPSASDPG